jgi:hypothetical protein
MKKRRVAQEIGGRHVLASVEKKREGGARAGGRELHALKVVAPEIR